MTGDRDAPSRDPGRGSGERLIGLRGATTVPRDEPTAIVQGTAELLRELLDRNGVDPADLVSLMFTATPDLRSEFPAAAARRIGIADVPLLCAQELDVVGAVPRCIRVLAHLYRPATAPGLEPVYLHGARQLRADLAERATRRAP